MGLQADANYLDSNGSFTCLQARTTLIGSNCEVSTHGLATAAGRIGFLVDPLHHTLIYGKAGGAWMDSHIVIHPNAGVDAPTTTDAGAWGGLVGAGIERALTPAWSVSLEYDHYRFASTNVSTPQTIDVTRSTAPVVTPVAASTSGVTSDTHGLRPHLVRRFKLSNDPQFAAKLKEIVGLYIDPPSPRHRSLGR